jgi:trehalose 6-phosphate phosphatase
VRGEPAGKGGGGGVIPILAAGDDILDQVAAARALLAFDYDGTLAPYTDDRTAATMRSETRRLLRTAALLYPCAVVSGRSRADVAARLEGIPLIGIIGNHGAEAGFGPLDGTLRARVEEWQARLEPALADADGVEIENKGFSIALHHRRAPSWGKARARIQAAISRLERAVVFEGHAVVNVLPEGAPTKANAIRQLCERSSLNVVVYVGDDTSDEEAFQCDAVTISIRIGLDTASRARFGLAEQAEVDDLLRSLIVARARLDGRGADCDGIVRALGEDPAGV